VVLPGVGASGGAQTTIALNTEEGEDAMRSKLLVGLAPLVSAVALAGMPAVSQASPHWYENGVLLTKMRPVKTSGTLTFSLPAVGLNATCTLKDLETIENPASGGPGVDLMKKFTLTKCGPSPCPLTSKNKPAALAVTALNLPWKTELVEVPPIADEIKGMELQFSCKGFGPFAVFTGTLSPWVGPALLEFNSPLTGTLGGLGVNGIDTLTSPLGITAKNP
jgi:hypothetical protein